MINRWELQFARYARCRLIQSCPILCNPMEYSPPGSSVRGTFQARILEWVAISSSKASSQTQVSNPSLLCHLNCRQILYHRATREGILVLYCSHNKLSKLYQIKIIPINTVQFSRSKMSMDSTGFSVYHLTRLKSRCWQGWALT